MAPAFRDSAFSDSSLMACAHFSSSLSASSCAIFASASRACAILSSTSASWLCVLWARWASCSRASKASARMACASSSLAAWASATLSRAAWIRLRFSSESLLSDRSFLAMSFMSSCRAISICGRLFPLRLLVSRPSAFAAFVWSTPLCLCLRVQAWCQDWENDGRAGGGLVWRIFQAALAGAAVVLVGSDVYSIVANIRQHSTLS
mmetsp:Transcript_6573/g.18335  ORF Transcript_6573/g.18335 Transcript_6573/m.18335 type:complete len:206 (+) Transcript_6573:759-1376(+)